MPLEPRLAPPALRSGRADAGFLTQLIACERRLPAYRERRTADPQDASARYRATLAAAARPLVCREL
ncbi:hypothetical protein [Salinarimonas ramus]|uniref:hypothetical protein n=1 Tax=Salinarimonas ramus TaxID=690164 RepID=UPI00166717A0|nr:hypothetical protein [Salinarimonas ramus]